jgi:hypothetical protein
MKRILLLITVLGCSLPAQTPEVSITAKGTYTTSTRFLYDIDKPLQYFDGNVLESNYGFGFDVRWNILWDRFSIGTSLERIRSVGLSYIQYPQFQNLRVVREEGFELTAIEISGYYVVPISSDNIQFYLGGGIGNYDGERIYAVAGVQAATVQTTSNLGIHVLTGIDYWFLKKFGVRGELKFRDPHFDVTNKFDQSSVTVAGYQIPLNQRESTTRVNLYGVNYMLGFVVIL